MALNTGFPAYLQLLRFLRVLGERFPPVRVGKPRRKAEPFTLHDLLLEPDTREVSAKQLGPLFFFTAETRILLGIAAIGDTDVTDLVGTFNLEQALGLERGITGNAKVLFEMSSVVDAEPWSQIQSIQKLVN